MCRPETFGHRIFFLKLKSKETTLHAFPVQGQQYTLLK